MTPPAGQNVGRPEGWQRLSSRSSRLRGNSAPLPPCLALRWRRMRLERDAAPEARHGPPRRTPSPLPIMPHPGRRPGVLTRGAGHSTPSNGSHPGACPSPLPQFRRAPLHFGWPASHTVACQPRPNALPGTVPTVTRRRDQCPLCIGGPLLSPRHSAPPREQGRRRCTPARGAARACPLPRADRSVLRAVLSAAWRPASSAAFSWLLPANTALHPYRASPKQSISPQASFGRLAFARRPLAFEQCPPPSSPKAGATKAPLPRTSGHGGGAPTACLPPWGWPFFFSLPSPLRRTLSLSDMSTPCLRRAPAARVRPPPRTWQDRPAPAAERLLSK